MFTRKWQYLFAYAAAGFAKGYITCHMLTFIRGVRAHSFLWSLRDIDHESTHPTERLP
jgi:hypothetical protein